MGQPCDKGGESRFWGEKQVFGVRNKFSGLRNKFRNKFLFLGAKMSAFEREAQGDSRY